MIIIVRYFPHEVSDVSIAIAYMNAENGPASIESQWMLRYCILLWLSLVCMIPFDFAQFDEGVSGHTVQALEEIGKRSIMKAGIEREGAILLLARLYMR